MYNRDKLNVQGRQAIIGKEKNCTKETSCRRFKRNCKRQTSYRRCNRETACRIKAIGNIREKLHRGIKLLEV